MSSTLSSLTDCDRPAEDHKDWTEGDFSIISSDNVRFRIHSYHLLSASAFFRDLSLLANVRSSQPREVRLTDSDFETRSVVEDFCVLITSRTLEKKLHRSTVAEYIKLAEFLLKYQCPSAVETLKLVIRKNYQQHGSGIYGFIVGAFLDDVDLCVDCMSSEESRKDIWFQRASEPWHSRLKTNTFNPAGLPFDLFSFIPTPYIWALSQAWGLFGEEADLPLKFKELLKGAKGWKR